MSIADVLTSNLLDNVHAITGFDMFITLILAFGMGMFILFIYGRIYQGAMYSSSFAVSLVALVMISATLILAVTSNLVLSLGMVGALSIGRFRTAIKDPMEIVFLFWAIETGIVLATGIFTLAVGVNIVIGCVLLALVIRKPDYPYILVLKCEESAVKAVENILKSHTYYTVKSRKVETQPKALQGAPEDAKYMKTKSSENKLENTSILELDIEITLKQEARKHRSSGFDETKFVDDLSKIEGVSKAILVTYNGGYMS